MKVRNVAIVSKPKQPKLAKVARELAQWFADKQIKANIDPTQEVALGADLAVVIGGDGTLLAAARLVGDCRIPILAINYGSLGFLTEVTLDQMYPALQSVLDDRFAIDDRMMMNLAVERGNNQIAFHRALNDVVINKGTVARIIELEVRVDGQYVSSFRSDGLIVSTPTGSTAYNLSAGGPIIFPSMSAMIVTPICSHTLTNRPIVLPPDVKIETTLKSSQNEVHVTVDGQVGLPLETGDRVLIEKSDVVVKLIAPTDKNYFDVLRGKLKWG